MLKYHQIENIPKIDTHVNLRMDELARTQTNDSNDIYRLVSKYCEKAVKSNVVVSELVYTPEVYTVPMKDGLSAVVNAAKECSNNNFHINLSIQFLRDEPEEKALERFDILREWLKWNRGVSYFITGITIGSFWNHMEVEKYSTFLKRTKELLPDVGLSVNLELNPRTKLDIQQLINFSQVHNIEFRKFIINGFGKNTYESTLLDDEQFISMIFANQIPVVISPRNDTNLITGLSEQLTYIKKWLDKGYRIVLNSDDYFKEDNVYGDFNSILEQTFTLYDKDYWARNEYPYWNKDHIIGFMKTAQSCSYNRHYNVSNLFDKYQEILNDPNF